MKGLTGRPESVSLQNASSDTLASSPPAGWEEKVSDHRAGIQSKLEEAFCYSDTVGVEGKGRELQMQLHGTAAPGIKAEQEQSTKHISGLRI